MSEVLMYALEDLSLKRMFILYETILQTEKQNKYFDGQFITVNLRTLPIYMKAMNDNVYNARVKIG